MLPVTSYFVKNNGLKIAPTLTTENFKILGLCSRYIVLSYPGITEHKIL